MTGTTAHALPEFRYHPDPVASGSVVRSTNGCACCGTAQGLVYAGPVYGEEDDLEDALCPWCIADGSAHEKFGVTFVDAEALDSASEEILEVITERTPGFNSWQHERWLSCCGEPAAFVDSIDANDLQTKYIRLEGTLMTFVVQTLGISGGAARRVLNTLRRDGSPTAFVFQCHHCEFQPAYVDLL